MEPSQKKGPRVSIGLVHHPVYNQKRNIVATNITNFDIHDISRVATAYGIDNYYIIHPMREQLMFVHRVLEHWSIGTGAKYNPLRRTALSFTRTAETIEEAIRAWDEPEGWVIATSAKEVPGKERLGFRQLRAEILEREQPCLILFGTGFGLSEAAYEACHGVLEPIQGAPPQDYRHLSVRSAVSICLDRLLGTW